MTPATISRAARALQNRTALWPAADGSVEDHFEAAALTALTAALDDPEFANHIRDWRLTPCEHSRPLRYGPDLSGSAGRREQACSPCLRDRLRAYLLGGAS